MLKELLADAETASAMRDWVFFRNRIENDEERKKLVTKDRIKRAHLGVYNFSPKDEKYFPAMEKVHRLLGAKSDFPEKEIPIGELSELYFPRIHEVVQLYDKKDSDFAKYREIIGACYGHIFVPGFMIDRRVLKRKRDQPYNILPIDLEYSIDKRVRRLLPSRKH
jgi:hypothetical protein